MSIAKGWLRRSLLAGVYALGVFGILASGDGSDGDVFRTFTCGLSVQGIAPVGDGTVWVGVFAKTNTDTEDRVVLLGTDGSELLSTQPGLFGDGGTENAIRAVARVADGSVYVGGDFIGGILRLKDNGELDTDFLVGAGFDDRVTSIVPVADGSDDIYVGGSFSTYKGNIVSGLVRLDNTGMNVGVNPTVGAVESVAMEAPGISTNVYTGGVFNGIFFNSGIGRWNDLGIADDQNFFPPNGVSPVSSVVPALDGSGDVYAGGNFATGIIRLSNGGTTDGGFSANVGTGFDSDVLSMDRAVIGGLNVGIYVGGDFTTYDSDPSNGIARIASNGNRDLTFVVGSGFADPNGIFPFSKVASVVQDTSGSDEVFVGGGFTEYNGVASNGIVRLDTVGSPTAFDVSINIDGEVCDSQTIPEQP